MIDSVDLKKLATEKGATFINAETKILGTIPRVMVKVPKGTFVPDHKIMVWSEGKKDHETIILEVPSHKRAPLYVDKSFISRDFYTGEGKWIVCKVQVVLKKDYYRNKETIGLNFFPEKNEPALYQLKIGTPKEFPISFEIPGTQKFIAFEEI